MMWEISYWCKVLIFWGCYCHITVYPEWFTVCDWEEGREWKPEVKAIITQRVYTLSPISCSVAQLCPTRSTPWTAACQISLVLQHLWSLLKLLSIESVMPSIYLILCCPLLLLPAIFPSIRVFSNELTLHIRWPKYWSFSFSISPSNEYSGLISFRMDWLDLLAVHGNLKSLLQHHSSKASFFQCSAFFMVQLSHSYMTTGKTIALIRWTFVGKVMSLLFNMLFSICHLIIIKSTRKNIIGSNSASQEKKNHQIDKISNRKRISLRIPPG